MNVGIEIQPLRLKASKETLRKTFRQWRPDQRSLQRHPILLEVNLKEWKELPKFKGHHLTHVYAFDPVLTEEDKEHLASVLNKSGFWEVIAIYSDSDKVKELGYKNLKW